MGNITDLGWLLYIIVDRLLAYESFCFFVGRWSNDKSIGSVFSSERKNLEVLRIIVEFYSPRHVITSLFDDRQILKPGQNA